jgi:hypothetical protein
MKFWSTTNRWPFATSFSSSNFDFEVPKNSKTKYLEVVNICILSMRKYKPPSSRVNGTSDPSCYLSAEERAS